MTPVGTEWLIDAAGCRPEVMRYPAALGRQCRRILVELDLRIVGQGAWHQFPPPGGLTGFYLLCESHLACHTYPEHGVASFNLYCCRARPEWPWEDRLSEMLGATSVAVRRIGRGSGEGGAAGKGGAR